MALASGHNSTPPPVLSIYGTDPPPRTPLTDIRLEARRPRGRQIFKQSSANNRHSKYGPVQCEEKGLPAIASPVSLNVPINSHRTGQYLPVAGGTFVSRARTGDRSVSRTYITVQWSQECVLRRPFRAIGRAASPDPDRPHKRVSCHAVDRYTMACLQRLTQPGQSGEGYRETGVFVTHLRLSCSVCISPQNHFFLRTRCEMPELHCFGELLCPRRGVAKRDYQIVPRINIIFIGPLESWKV
ncbi:hypothetical protein J6590_071509 [Homalodisca vitripennis]|nr:hypothetical protein J6590_071509 [Homalodisca vitripennis]